jgi:hypothetical protein
MSAKHTPGPWAIDWNVSRIDVFSADAATLVATIRRSTLSAGIDDVAKANARLIAAAPDLLEALILLLNVEKAALIGAEAPGLKGLDVSYHFEAARAAIARAKINAAIALATGEPA